MFCLSFWNRIYVIGAFFPIVFFCMTNFYADNPLFFFRCHKDMEHKYLFFFQNKYYQIHYQSRIPYLKNFLLIYYTIDEFDLILFTKSSIKFIGSASKYALTLLGLNISFTYSD